VSEFHAKAPQAIVSEGLAQGPFMTARAGFKPATLRTKGAESTNEPLRSTNAQYYMTTLESAIAYLTINLYTV